MKIAHGAMVAFIATSLISFSAFAATEITKEEAKKYEEVGKVSTTKEHTSPHDAMEEIAKKADEMGGKYFVITSGQEGDKVRGTATVYK